MSAFLLDTNVLSEVIKRSPCPEVIRRVHSLPPGQAFTSAVCVTELRYGAARRPDGPQLWRRIEDELLARVAILSFGVAEAIRAGDVLSELAARGQPIGVEDTLIGATALVHGLVVATRNTRHLGRIEGLRVESWWPA